ncbi:uncharacterized protein I206_101661 [Kwoniella pini CBS 10737]|uniref:Copper transport protein n=1 Tax=Kwoniella pini CBS 10737 TaxID=1296096 RepID=A0A1B9HW32_9TREE|nr:uncharacterized protein I206_06370 [Kwoniella pini CBS 10737]OCF47469.1 hypothetical protein I206_06370 [Kwoniella pini CBS 10737]
MDHMSSSNTTCQMSDMLWNWDVINTCFISSGWQNSTKGSFAASCIGVSFISILLELFKKISKDYDKLILKQLSNISFKSKKQNQNYFIGIDKKRRATPLQQLIRTLLHVLIFGISYLLMLLVMSFNGFLIFSILIGHGIGKFFCDWLILGLESISNEEEEPNVCCG